MTEKMIKVLSIIATKKLLNCLSQEHRQYIVRDNFFSCERTSLLEMCVLSIYKKKNSWNSCDMLDVIGHAALAGANIHNH